MVVVVLKCVAIIIILIAFITTLVGVLTPNWIVSRTNSSVSIGIFSDSQLCYNVFTEECTKLHRYSTEKTIQLFLCIALGIHALLTFLTLSFSLPFIGIVTLPFSLGAMTLIWLAIPIYVYFGPDPCGNLETSDCQTPYGYSLLLVVAGGIFSLIHLIVQSWTMFIEYIKGDE